MMKPNQFLSSSLISLFLHAKRPAFSNGSLIVGCWICAQSLRQIEITQLFIILSSFKVEKWLSHSDGESVVERRVVCLLTLKHKQTPCWDYQWTVTMWEVCKDDLNQSIFCCRETSSVQHLSIWWSLLFHILNDQLILFEVQRGRKSKAKKTSDSNYLSGDERLTSTAVIRVS